MHKTAKQYYDFRRSTADDCHRASQSTVTSPLNDIPVPLHAAATFARKKNTVCFSPIQR